MDRIDANSYSAGARSGFRHQPQRGEIADALIARIAAHAVELRADAERAGARLQFGRQKRGRRDNGEMTWAVGGYVGDHPVPAKSNPLGTKGCGEAGCAGSLSTLTNAVLDALSELGITHIDMPLTPERVWRAIRDAKAKVA